MTSDYDPKACELGAKIKAEIKRKGVTQAEFAEVLGLTPSRLSNYITGARLPDVFMLSRIAGALGLTVDHLLGLEGGGVFPMRYTMIVFESGAVRLTPQS
ncbi:MAG: helix-turn-helix domain-containing protein [Deferribacterales bacterium]|jgi:transcriptional regulator with XRE-family HTH domain